MGDIANSTIGHEVKKQNERYEFPCTLEIRFKNGVELTKRQVEAAVRHHTSKQLTVYSAYGSPYLCSFQNVKATKFDQEENIANVKLFGKAVRRRDIPTLAQQKEEERNEKGHAEEEELTQESKKSKLELHGLITNPKLDALFICYFCSLLVSTFF